jgi:hypothetical protein
VQDVVELLRQPGVEVVTRPFAFREIEHVDCALEARRTQDGRQLERREDGADDAMRIESADSAKAILRFRLVVLPETGDGMVHG